MSKLECNALFSIMQTKFMRMFGGSEHLVSGCFIILLPVAYFIAVYTLMYPDYGGLNTMFLKSLSMTA